MQSDPAAAAAAELLAKRRMPKASQVRAARPNLPELLRRTAN
jgi:hypothetical protein